MFIQSRDPARPEDEPAETREPKARSAPGGSSLSQTLARMRRTSQGDDLTVMNYTTYLPTPVYSSDKLPLMPCHPARARILLRNGRAVPHHTKGIFGIRMLDRTREESEVQEIDLHIDQGSRTTGIAVTTDNPEGERTVLAAVEIRHRAPAIKNKMTKRSNHRRGRRHKLRYRQPRKNHRPKPGTLTPSVDSLRVDTMRAVNTIQQIYPISAISIERNKFDPQLMMDPNIKGTEYQRGTRFGWQLRAYIFDRDHGRCICCGKNTGRLELDHIRPRAIGSNRVDNLAVLCRECNLAKKNRPIEEFLKDQPELLQRILARLEKIQPNRRSPHQRRSPSHHQRPRSTGPPPHPNRRSLSILGPKRARNTQNPLLRRRTPGRQFHHNHHPASQGAGNHTHERPLQAKGQRGRRRHPQGSTIPKGSEQTQAPPKTEPSPRPLRPPPAPRPTTPGHRRHRRRQGHHRQNKDTKQRYHRGPDRNKASNQLCHQTLPTHSTKSQTFPQVDQTISAKAPRPKQRSRNCEFRWQPKRKTNTTSI